MIRYEYGNTTSSNVLIQLVNEHELSVIESEISVITEKAGDDFFLMAFKADNWNDELSPWTAPAVFSNESFAGHADKTLSVLLAELNDPEKKYYIGGYSLAGLFALWAIFNTDRFAGVAAASPSIWFPGFIEYMTDKPVLTDKVYLSLGDKEEKTKNQLMASVGDCIRSAYDLLTEKGTECTLEWNKGNHFKETEIRTATAFAWVLKTR